MKKLFVKYFLLEARIVRIIILVVASILAIIMWQNPQNGGILFVVTNGLLVSIGITLVFTSQIRRQFQRINADLTHWEQLVNQGGKSETVKSITHALDFKTRGHAWEEFFVNHFYQEIFFDRLKKLLTALSFQIIEHPDSKVAIHFFNAVYGKAQEMGRGAGTVPDAFHWMDDFQKTMKDQLKERRATDRLKFGETLTLSQYFKNHFYDYDVAMSENIQQERKFIEAMLRDGNYSHAEYVETLAYLTDYPETLYKFAQMAASIYVHHRDGSLVLP